MSFIFVFLLRDFLTRMSNKWIYVVRHVHPASLLLDILPGKILCWTICANFSALFLLSVTLTHYNFTSVLLALTFAEGQKPVESKTYCVLYFFYFHFFTHSDQDEIWSDVEAIQAEHAYFTWEWHLCNEGLFSWNYLILASIWTFTNWFSLNLVWWYILLTTTFWY